MIAVAALIGAAAVVGVAVWVLVRRWPRADPAAPHLTHLTADTPATRSLLEVRTDPAKATGLALTAAVVAVVAAGVAVGLLFAMVRRNLALARLDVRAARWGSRHGTDASEAVLEVITFFGGTMGVVALTVVVGIVEYRRVPSRSLVPFLTLVVVGQNLLANLIKLIVDRARPDIDPLAGFSGSSFPSGHSTAAAATFAALALVAGRRRSVGTKAVLAGLAAAGAVAVAGSRVLLGVHWLTDVLAGLALGWGWFALCSIAFGGRLLRFGAPVEAAQRHHHLEEVAARSAPPRPA